MKKAGVVILMMFWGIVALVLNIKRKYDFYNNIFNNSK